MNSIFLRPLSLLVFTLFVSLAVSQARAAERKLSFAVSGIVATLEVRTGDSVKAGTVLATLDRAPFNARKRAADANAAAARLMLELATVKLEQVRELFDALSSSQEEVDEAEITHAKALSGYEAARSRAEIAAWRLRRAALTAPFSGTVTDVPGYPGMVVNTHADGQAVVVVNAP